MPYKSKHKLRAYDRRYQRQRKRERRLIVIGLLGGRCVWPGCDEQDPDRLEFDHALGDKQRGKAYKDTESNEWVRWSMERIKANMHRFQLLCRNHNLEKEWVGGVVPPPGWVGND